MNLQNDLQSASSKKYSCSKIALYTSVTHFSLTHFLYSAHLFIRDKAIKNLIQLKGVYLFSLIQPSC
jgi:hypothetical protein